MAIRLIRPLKNGGNTSSKIPNSAEAHYAIGITYLNARLRDQAIEHLRQAAKIAPEVADIHYTLSLAIFNDGMFSGAEDESQELEEAMKTASKISSDFRDAAAYKHIFKAMRLQCEDLDLAIREFIKATEISSVLSLAWHSMGWCYAGLDRWEDAHFCYTRAVNLNPKDVGHPTGGAVACSQLGRIDEAIQWAKKAISNYSENPSIHRDLDGADAYFQLYTFLREKSRDSDRILMSEAHEAIRMARAISPVESNGIDLGEHLQDMNTLESKGYKQGLFDKLFG